MRYRWQFGRDESKESKNWIFLTGFNARAQIRRIQPGALIQNLMGFSPLSPCRITAIINPFFSRRKINEIEDINRRGQRSIFNYDPNTVSRCMNGVRNEGHV